MNGATALTLRAGSGTVTLTGAVGGTAPLTNLAFTSAALIQVGSNITVTGANPLLFPSPVSLLGTSTMTSNGANITFNSTLDGAQSLTLVGGAGTISFVGAVGGSTPLTNLAFTSAALIQIGSNITISGANPLTFPSPVNLTGNSTIFSNNANISFNSTLNGAQNLVIEAGSGIVTFTGVVGGTTPLLSLIVTAGEVDVFANITASGGTLLFNAPVVLNASMIFTDTGSGMTFLDTITGPAFNLGLQAPNGQITVNGVINTLSLDADSSTNATFNGDITTGANTSIASSAGSVLVENITSAGGSIALQPSATEIPNLISAGDLMPQGILVLRGNLQAAANVSLSAAGRTAFPSVATIANSTGNSFTITAGTLTIGDNEALTVFGDVNFNIAGAAHFGQIVSSEQIVITSGSNEIFLHDPAEIYSSFGQLYTNDVTNLIDRVTPPSITPAATFTGPGAPATFDVSDASKAELESMLVFSGYVLTLDLQALPPPPPPTPPSPSNGNVTAAFVNFNALVATAEMLEYRLPMKIPFQMFWEYLCNEGEESKRCQYLKAI